MYFAGFFGTETSGVLIRAPLPLTPLMLKVASFTGERTRSTARRSLRTMTLDAAEFIRRKPRIMPHGADWRRNHGPPATWCSA